jgi:lysozyme
LELHQWTNGLTKNTMTMKITKTGTKGIELIKAFEGFRSKPYKCPAGIPTIGYGATFYPGGKKVTMADAPITEEQGTELLQSMLVNFEKYVDSYCRDDINQNQFDALVSFAYNLGPANLKSSTLLKKVNANPEDETIRAEFMKWVKAGGKTLQGLVKRRTAEANLYFTK